MIYGIERGSNFTQRSRTAALWGAPLRHYRVCEPPPLSSTILAFGRSNGALFACLRFLPRNTTSPPRDTTT